MSRISAERASAENAGTEESDFEAVFLAQQDRLVRLAGLLCGDGTRAEDAVADVFARLYRRWDAGAIENVNAYLRRAVVNEVGAGFRRRARATRFLRRHVAAPATPPDEAVAERDRLWRAMLRLSERQRAVLVLRYFDDASEAAVAEILDLPVGTVKSTTARGLDRLRQILGDNDDA